MTQEEFDKAPLLDQILYDETGMLAENHPDIVVLMQKYAKAMVIKYSLQNKKFDSFVEHENHVKEWLKNNGL